MVSWITEATQLKESRGALDSLQREIQASPSLSSSTTEPSPTIMRRSTPPNRSLKSLFSAIYWTLPPGSFFGSFFKGKIEKMKVMGPFEIWNKQNVARTPLVTSTSPPPPFALFWNVTFSVPKRDTTFWVDCIDSTVPLPPKHIKSIIDSLSYQQTFTFTFLQLFLCVLPGRNVE